MEYEDRLTIATPEGVELELTLAGLGSRAAARALDLLILGVVVAALGVVLLVSGAFGRGEDGEAAVAIALYVAAAFLVMFSYDVLFETLGSGRTPGKRIVGLRVVRSSGRPIGFRSSAVRNVLRLVEGPALSWAPALVSVLATRRNQRLGDLAADAIVVRDRVGPRRRGRPEEDRGTVPARGPERPRATTPTDPGTLPAEAETWDVSAVTGEELSAVRRFLERRHGLDPAPRKELAAELAGRLQLKVAGAPDGLPPEAFLERLSAAKAARR